MAENSHISWTNHTFNPWIGCTKVSRACDGCYAAELMGTEGGRFRRVTWGEPGKGEGTRDRTKDWSKPRKWNRQAADAPGQTFVFCASLADVFDNAVPPEWRRDLFRLIRETPNLTYLLLTKRPGMIAKLFEEITDKDQAHDALRDYWPPNAAIGCTVINQEEADRDVPKLLATATLLRPAFTFLSMEPLLGPVDLTRLSTTAFRGAECLNALTGELSGIMGEPGGYLPALGWVITGGETDQGAHKARPGDPDWYRSLRDQCAATGVPYHHKQNGEWVGTIDLRLAGVDWEGSPYTTFSTPPTGTVPGTRFVARVGKDRDPCTLDGVKHLARPSVREHA